MIVKKLFVMRNVDNKKDIHYRKNNCNKTMKCSEYE